MRDKQKIEGHLMEEVVLLFGQNLVGDPLPTALVLGLRCGYIHG